MTQRKPRKSRAVKQGPRNDKRQLFSLDEKTIWQLEGMAQESGKSKSALVREAVAQLYITTGNPIPKMKTLLGPKPTNIEDEL